MSTLIQTNPKLFWAFWGFVAAVWQYMSLRTHNGGTGSETTRAVLKTNTRAGRWAFILGYIAFTAWFPKHILKPIEKAMIAVSGSEETQHANQ
jgi:hypothetical protein